MIDLFTKETAVHKFYDTYNGVNNPVLFLQEKINPENYSEKELEEMDFNWIIKIVGYEWLKYQKKPEVAIKGLNMEFV